MHYIVTIILHYRLLAYMYITMLTIFGLKGGWTSLFISFSQFVCLKNTWSLMLCSPFSPQPKRLAGCLVRNYTRKENQITHVSYEFTSKRKKKLLGSLIWAALSDILHLLTFLQRVKQLRVESRSARIAIGDQTGFGGIGMKYLWGLIVVLQDGVIFHR